MEGPTKKRKTGKYCCAGAPNDTSCMNSSYTPNVSMHVFPQNEKQRSKWTQFVRRHRAGFTPSKSSVLCSIHFKPTDFVRRIDINSGANAEATKMRRLEIGAIPTIDAAGAAPTRPQSKRDQRYMKKVRYLHNASF